MTLGDLSIVSSGTYFLRVFFSLWINKYCTIYIYLVQVFIYLMIKFWKFIDVDFEAL